MLDPTVVNRPTNDITDPAYNPVVPPAPPPPTVAAVLSPEWWRTRLLKKLQERAAIVEPFYQFYEGNQPLALASQKFQEVFGTRYSRLPTNFMPLVVGAEQERLVINGFRFGTSTQADKTAWGIWQDNQMDAESQIAHETALVKGVAYAAVDPTTTGGPSISIEDPTETIVETAPGNRRVRLAALKTWTGEDGYQLCFLYLPDEIYRWRSETTVRSPNGDASQTRWVPFTEDNGDAVLTNRLGVVPIVPLLNRPRRDGTGRSEIVPVMGSQNAINKLRFDALIASEFVAFPQRWATNIDVPIDPDTGKPIQPFRPGVDNLWVARRPTADESMSYGDKVPQPTFGQFPEASLHPYIDMIQAEVGQMASVSRTPYHYLLGEPTSVPPSGESLKSSEAALVRKVETESIHLGEGWEEVMRLCLVAVGQSKKASSGAETIWADTETRNEAARGDTVLKQYAAGLLPPQIALEQLGYSQQTIERIQQINAAQPPVATAPVTPSQDTAGKPPPSEGGTPDGNQQPPVG